MTEYLKEYATLILECRFGHRFEVRLPLDILDDGKRDDDCCPIHGCIGRLIRAERG